MTTNQRSQMGRLRNLGKWRDF